MRPVLTAQQMQTCDRAAIAAGTPSVTLMERAARAVYEELTPHITMRDRVLVLCGTGNNGGDGFCLALLLRRAGYSVSVCCLEGGRSPDAAHFYEACQTSGVPFASIAELNSYPVLVDALFGTGLSRPLNGEALDWVRRINEAPASLKLSVDLPSGLNADNGRILGDAVRAHRTVTFAAYKLGLLLGEGRDQSGEVVLKDIGVDVDVPECVMLPDAGDYRAYFPPRKINTHKGSYGRAAVIAGSRRYFGAGVLSASAVSALRTGAGYCYLACPESEADLYRTRLPEAICCPLKSDGDGSILYDEKGLDELLERADSVAVGMGLGVSEAVYRTVCRVLAKSRVPVVLDADALNCLSKYGLAPLESASAGLLLTPHPGEFSRLNCGADGGGGPVSLARDFARRFSCTVLLKGATSVITDGKQTVLNTAGSPCLAKGGSGDVLSGALAALLAAGRTPFEAAVAGSYLFGTAGELAAAELSEYAPLATDVANRLPAAILKIQGRA